MLKKLTPKQAAFVSEYLIDMNAAGAARRAGYNPKRADNMGYELLRKPEIAAALAKAQEKRAARMQIDADTVLRDIEEIKRDAMNPAIDHQGNKAMNNHNAALRAAELIGKHVGMWADKLQLTGKDGADLSLVVLLVDPADGA